MSVSVCDLIAQLGDDNIQLQNLDNCATKLNYSKKNGTAITFVTETPLTPQGTERLGLVLWLPRDKVAEILAKS